MKAHKFLTLTYKGHGPRYMGDSTFSIKLLKRVGSRAQRRTALRAITEQLAPSAEPEFVFARTLDDEVTLAEFSRKTDKPVNWNAVTGRDKARLKLKYDKKNQKLMYASCG
jgi:hypothetical protein